MNKQAKIYIAGHGGLVGSAIVHKLHDEGYRNLLLRKRSELDLSSQQAVRDFFSSERPEYVIDSAAKVGGIGDNIAHPAEYLYENLQIQNNLFWSAKEANVKKFIFLGSSCIYPTDSPQPIREESFMKGDPGHATEAYAHAKIAGIKLCEYIYDEYHMSFISCAPTNIYGEGSSFDPNTAHVIPSLIHRIHQAKKNNIPTVTVWGTGKSRREFLYVDDLADAVVWLMNHYDSKQFLNVGTGEDISIKDLAIMVKKLIGYSGDILFDSSKPDGATRRQLDVSRLHTAGWHHKTNLNEGLSRTYEWYLANELKE